MLPPGLRAHGQLLSPRCTYEHQRPPLSFTLMHFAWHLPGAHDQLWMYKPSHAHIPLSLQGCFPRALCDADVASPEQAYEVRKAAASPGDSLQPPGDPALWICICPRIAWVWKNKTTAFPNHLVHSVGRTTPPPAPGSGRSTACLESLQQKRQQLTPHAAQCFLKCSLLPLSCQHCTVTRSKEPAFCPHLSPGRSLPPPDTFFSFSNPQLCHKLSNTPRYFVSLSFFFFLISCILSNFEIHYFFFLLSKILFFLYII